MEVLFFWCLNIAVKPPEFKKQYSHGLASYVQQFWIDAIVHILPPTFTSPTPPPLPPLPPLTNLRPVRKHVPEILEHVKIIGCSASNFVFLANKKFQNKKQKTKEEQNNNNNDNRNKEKKKQHTYTQRDTKSQTSNIKHPKSPEAKVLFIIYLFVFVFLSVFYVK